MIGKLLGGRYQVIGTLSTGGFGQTYAAEDTHRPGSPKCVVKHLKPASSNSSFLQSARRLFQSEAETLEKLGSHDQIPRLLAYFEEDKEFYLVQEFIQGHPLTARLQPGQCWSESQVCRLLQEVLGILEFVHSNGVIHRDIKPNNIIQRQQDCRFILVDFGSVKQTWKQVVTAQGQTSTSFTESISATIGIGTPGYMPTEQGRGRPRPNSDIYALGIIAIQALTGLNPMQFEEDADTGEIIWQNRVQVSDQLASVIAKMVCYHFKDRFQTAAEVLEALNGINPPTHLSALDTDIEVLPVQQAPTPQITVFLPQFVQEPLPDPNVISVVGTNRSDTLIRQAPHAAMPASHLPVTAAVSAQPTISQLKSSQASINGKEIPEETASSAKMIQKYSDSAATYNQLRVGAGITAILISLVAGYSLYWQPRPSISKTLERIETLKAAGKYQECVSQAPTIPQHSFFYTDAQALLHECQFAQAKTLAAERKFYAAISEANKIPQNTAFYQDSQKLIAQWSDDILQVATNTYKSGKLNEAIAITDAIPETSSVYKKTQGAVKQWQQEWTKNNSYLQAAQKALSQNKWQNAVTEAKKVTDTPYWQEKVEPIIQKAQSKIAASKTTPSQPRRASRRLAVSANRTPVHTTPRRVTRTATRTPVRTTPRRVTRTATRTPVRTTPRRITRTAAKAPVRTPRRVTRTTPRRVTRTAAKKPIRTTPLKPSYTWTTKTVP